MTWTGANDIQSEGSFVWESSGLPLTYFNWLGGEPNNSGGDEGCVHLRVADAGQWNDEDCILPWPTMCEVIYTCT